jgi:hypothetical protein
MTTTCIPKRTKIPTTPGFPSSREAQLRSKILSLLDLDAEVQKLAREDDTGHITKRHLYAVKPLTPDQQQTLIRRVQSEAITADQTERLAVKETRKLRSEPRRGAPVSQHRFRTTHATVSFVFRKKDVSSDDIVQALDEVRGQIGPAERATPSGA